MPVTSTSTLILLIILLHGNIFAQSLLWEKTFPRKEDDGIHDVIQNLEGDLVLVGYTTASGNQNLLFLKTDAEGNIIAIDSSIGGTRSDAGLALVQTFDGGYAAAGYTGARGRNGTGKQAWLVKLDAGGKMLWESSPCDGAFTDLFQDDAGNLWLAGHCDRRLCVAKYSPGGKLLILADTFDIKISAGEMFRLEAGANGVFLIANLPDEVLLLCINDAGKTLWKKRIKNLRDAVVCRDHKGELAMTGVSGHKDQMLLRLDAEGNPTDTAVLAQTGDKDFTDALLPCHDGSFLAIGHAYSHKPGALAPDGMVQRILPDSVAEPPRYFGGSKSDLFTAATQLADGSIVLAGSTDGGGSGLDMWLVKLNAETLPEQAGIPGIAVDSFLLTDGNGNGRIEPGESSWLTIFVRCSNYNAYNLTGVIQMSGVLGLSFPRKIVVGPLQAGARRRIVIPFSGDERLQTGKAAFELLFSAAPGLHATPFRFIVETLEKARPRLDFKRNTVEGKGNNTNGQAFKLTIWFGNTGEVAVDNTTLEFRLPQGIFNSDKKSIQVESLLPGEERERTIGFVVPDDFPSEQVRIHCRLSDEKGNKYADTTIVIERPLPPYPENHLRVEWLRTTPGAESPGLVRLDRNKPEATVVFRAESDKPLESEHFKLLTDTTSGKKSVVGDNCECRKIPPARKGRYTVEYRCPLIFDQGYNRVSLKVHNESGEASTPAYHFIERTRLYLLSIGVPQDRDGLKYTQNDARDFIAAFREQAGKLFESIESVLLDSTNTTACQNIQEQIEQLEIEYQNGSLRNNDMVVLFFSSHGFFDSQDSTLRIVAGDYPNSRKKSATIDFNYHVMRILNRIHCKKLILIDACRSGAALPYSDGAKNEPGFDELSSALIRLAEAAKSNRIITSCSWNESSYEDSEWKNGAFTQALLEAFANEEVDTQNGKIIANSNGDLVLTTTEIYEFVSKRVPFLVQQRGKRGPQNPYMTPSLRGEGLPLFFLGQ